MGFEQLDIVLNNPTAIYSCGQNLAGTIHITNNKTQKISGIRLDVKGLAKVLFTDCSFWEETTHRARENYLQVHSPLLSRDGEKSFTLAPGRYQLGFSLELPAVLAPSFEAKHGSISYKVQVTINRTWKLTGKSSRPFYVLRVADNTPPLFDMTPVESSLIKTPGFLPNDCGPITARVCVLRVKYLPGEDIIVCADILNQTGRSIKSSKILFVQHVTFRAEQKVKEVSQILHKKKRGKFRKCELWDQVPIPVPASIEPSRLPFCNIMDVSYSIQLIVNPGRLYKKLRVRSNVLIGTDFTKISLPPPYETNSEETLQLTPNGRIHNSRCLQLN